MTLPFYIVDQIQWHKLKTLFKPMYRITIFLLLLVAYRSSGFSQQTFDPKDRDRIIYLGNSLMENEQKYGFLEYLITSHHPETHLSFRNLGWSGDTVFGDARSYYTNPPGPFDLLIQQIKAVNPNWALLAYGNVEAEAGKEGIPEFTKGYLRLLDSLQAMNTEVILLSTIPQFSGGTTGQVEEKNQNLKLYNTQIADIANQRNFAFIDIYSAFENENTEKYWERNGIHLNEAGYYKLAQMILPFAPNKDILLDLNTGTLSTQDSILWMEVDKKAGTASFALNPQRPSFAPEWDENQPRLQVNGLKKGMYKVSMDSILVAIGTDKELENGILIRQSPSFSQSGELLELIREKDKIYFQQYRPQNRTYIIGFRQYEQGRHQQGLEALDTLLYWLEGKINLLKQPKTQHYQIQRVTQH